MFLNSEPIHRIIEQSNTRCNPFRHPTVIDLDKIFIAKRLLFPDTLKTECGINDALFARIQNNISTTIKRISLLDSELKAINPVLYV